MAREAILEINCCRYSERIMDLVNLFNELGWKYYDTEKKIEYLPWGDDDNFDWQKKFLSERELQELIDNKQNIGEQIGLSLYYGDSKEGVTLLAKSTKEIVILLNINRRTIDNHRDSITDIEWYFDKIIYRLKGSKCPIDYIKFEDYID